MNLNDIISPAILGISAFALLQIVQMKVQLERVMARLDAQDKSAHEFRNRMQSEYLGFKQDIKELWSEVRELQNAVGMK